MRSMTDEGSRSAIHFKSASDLLERAIDPSSVRFAATFSRRGRREIGASGMAILDTLG